MLSRFFKSRLRISMKDLTLQELRFQKFIVSSAAARACGSGFMGCQVLPGQEVAGKVLADGKLNANWRSKSN